MHDAITHDVRSGDDVRSQMERLELLDLNRVHTVGQLVDAMSRCSFGARMLGEVGETLTTWVRTKEKTYIVYDGSRERPLFPLLEQMVTRGWFVKILGSGDFFTAPRSIRDGANVLVVGPYMGRYEQLLYRRAGRIVFVNSFGMARPGQIRDGYFPDAVFADPNLIMPIFYHTLRERLEGQGSTVSQLIDYLRHFDGLATEVVDGAETLRAMIQDPDCTVIMTASGAMTIAKMGLLFCEMIDRGMIQYLATTGALMAHGLVEGIGLAHYKYNPKHNDVLLADQKINRVTDTLEPEENLDSVEEVIHRILASINGRGPHLISPSELHRRIGKYLVDHFPNERGILKSAYLKKVPVSVPAPYDSEIGNDLIIENMRRGEKGTGIILHHELDTLELIKLTTQAKRLGIFSIGGGVPRNNTQNVAPLVEIINTRLEKKLRPVLFNYGCRIDPTPFWFGNLSGCSYSENISWRKFAFDARTSEIRADATIVWPLLLKHVLEQQAA